MLCRPRHRPFLGRTVTFPGLLRDGPPISFPLSKNFGILDLSGNQSKGIFVANIGTFTKGWGQGQLVFRFEPCAELLLNTGTSVADRFPFRPRDDIDDFFDLGAVARRRFETQNSCSVPYDMVTFGNRLSDGSV